MCCHRRRWKCGFEILNRAFFPSGVAVYSSFLLIDCFAGEMNALGKRIESVDSELKQEEQALKEVNDVISEMAKELGSLEAEGQVGPNGETSTAQPGDERLEQIEGLKSRLELIKAMYGLSS